MRNFILGMMVGIGMAVCGYKPYQVEAEYLNNISAGLPAIQHTCEGIVTTGKAIIL